MNGGDGVYVYGSGGTFPTGSYNATNYWVDVVFTDPPPGFSPSMKAAAPSTTAATPSATVASPVAAPSATVAAPSPNKTQKHTPAVQHRRGRELVGLGRRGRDVHVDGPSRGPGRVLGQALLEGQPAARRESVSVEVRTGQTKTPDATWSQWHGVQHGGRSRVGTHATYNTA